MNTIALNNLPLSVCGHIKSLDTNEEIRRRLLDMGFTVGELVTPLFKSPLGDPVAYRIMGSAVALRNDTPSKISVSPIEQPEVLAP